ncbi:MAG: HEAT repeat domain-containing protein [Saprospiraceae bacterium]|nr:HEAT repeat domain-containing protein [Saprospiraceae bacterium]
MKEAFIYRTLTTAIIILFFFIPLSANINVRHIALNIGFDIEKQKATGSAEITLSPVVFSNVIFLDAANMTIHSVSAKGKPLNFEYDKEKENNNLKIQLPQFYNISDVVTLLIHYETHHINHSDPRAIWGSFGKGLRFFKPTFTTPNKWKQVWSSGQPNHNKYWFPCHEDISDLHTMELKVTVENPMVVISNGVLVEKKDNKNNTTTFHYKADQDFPNYLVSIVIGEYIGIHQNHLRIPITTFGYPNEKEAIEATVELVPDMMDFMITSTGIPYPFKSYNQVVIQDYPFPGLNGQHTMSIISDNYIDDYGVHKDFRYLWDGVALQAMAAQWFGNMISPVSWNHLWLHDAFTNYFAGKYTEQKNGRDEYLIWYALFYEKAAVKSDYAAGVRKPIVAEPSDGMSVFESDNTTKLRGTLVLRMLQKETGEEKWNEIIRHYTKNNAFRQVDTKAFRQSVEAVTGQSYEWFFDQWLYKTGYPDFEVIKTYNEKKKILTIELHQKQIRDTSGNHLAVEYFTGKMEIEIDGKIVPLTVNSEPVTKWEINLPTQPEYVNIDFEKTWIGDIIFEKNTEEHLHLLMKSKDVLARWESITHLTGVYRDSLTTAETKDKIILSFRKIISGNDYWRLRNYALSQLRNISSGITNKETEDLLMEILKEDESWVQVTAISFLSKINKPGYVHIFTEALNSKSDRVINAAAIALGKSKSNQAYDILIELDKKPSWKSQSRISALNGLEQLGDERAVEYVLQCLRDNKSPRWYLATPVWDYPFAAMNTLEALGKSELAFPILYERFQKSCEENDWNDLFQNVQLLNQTFSPEVKEIYNILKNKFIHDKEMLQIIQEYEDTFTESLKK